MFVQLVMLIPFLLIGSAFFGIQRFMNSFEKDYGSSNNTKVNAYKGTIISVERKYKSDTKYHIQLINENWFTKLLKFTGFSKEFQTGNTEFDEFFYIVSDDPKTCDILAANKDVQNQIYTLANAFENHGWRYIHLISDGSNVNIVFKNKEKLKNDEFDESEFNRLIDEHMAPILQVLRNPMVVSDLEVHHKTVKLINKVSIVLSSIAGILAFYIMFTLRSSDYWYLDLKSLFGSMALLGLGVVLFYVSYILKSFRGHSRIYRLLLYPTFAIFFSTFLSLYIFTRFSNVYLDESASKYALCTVKDKETFKPRRGSRKYTLTITHPFYYGELLEIHVPSKFYNSVQINKDMEIGIKDGYWGFEWVSSLSSTASSRSHYIQRKIRS
jgi:hypothetical protein